ncbi:MAG: AIPR family protein [Methanoregula sp.]
MRKLIVIVVTEEFTFLKDFEGRKDLKLKYESNALLLYALELKWKIDDIGSVAAQSLTDGSDDCKCDLVWVDNDKKVAVIAQSFFSLKERDKSKSNKAADLNTAATWLLSRDIDEIPKKIKPPTIELREAINSGTINRIEFWYVHNCPESFNVKNQLKTVIETAKNAIVSRFPQFKNIEIVALEIGLETLQEYYKMLKTPIYVSDTFQLEIPGGYVVQTNKWQAYSTAIEAYWLHNLFKKFGKKLFSANIRDYLGIRETEVNINYGIKKSASTDPENFWAFNIGITALVNNYRVIEKENRCILEIEGLSIVNGAQTTGAIGGLPKIPDNKALIPARFIKCSDRKIIQDIVRFNNSQNRILPADFRSNDNIQKKLRREFKNYPQFTYLGGRRGGEEDAISRPKNFISSDTAAQSLMSFHRDPVTAYQRKKEIWESDSTYSKIFTESTHAEHIIFVYTLFQAISEYKLSLMKKERDKKELTRDEIDNLIFLRYRGSIHLLIAAIAASMEAIVSRTLPDLSVLKFKERKTIDYYISEWTSIIQCCIPFNNELIGPLEKGLKNSAEVNESIIKFTKYIEATKRSNQDIFKKFSEKVESSIWQ